MFDLNVIKEKFIFWRFKRKYIKGSSFPVSISFYNELLSLFGESVTGNIGQYISYLAPAKLDLYTKDIYELNRLSGKLLRSINESLPFTGDDRLAAFTLNAVVERKSILNYLAIRNPDNLERQLFSLKSAIKTSRQLADLYLRLKESNLTLDNYYAEKVYAVVAETADIYYALIVFYLDQKTILKRKD